MTCEKCKILEETCKEHLHEIYTLKNKLNDLNEILVKSIDNFDKLLNCESPMDGKGKITRYE